VSLKPLPTATIAAGYAGSNDEQSGCKQMQQQQQHVSKSGAMNSNQSGKQQQQRQQQRSAAASAETKHCQMQAPDLEGEQQQP